LLTEDIQIREIDEFFISIMVYAIDIQFQHEHSLLFYFDSLYFLNMITYCSVWVE